MKKNKICPKCESKDMIYLAPQKRQNAYTDLVIDHTTIAKIERYICKNCGFLEEYVVLEDIKKLDSK